MGNVGDYHQNFELNRLRSQAHKAIRSANIGLHDIINVGTSIKGKYSGRFNLHMPEREIQIIYFSAEKDAQAKTLPQTLKLAGTEYSVKYIQSLPERIATALEQAAMLEKTKRRI
jgi:hypothetical protein